MEKTKNIFHFSLVIFFCCMLLFSYCNIAKATVYYDANGNECPECAPTNGVNTSPPPSTYKPTGESATENVPFTQTSPTTTTTPTTPAPASTPTPAATVSPTPSVLNNPEPGNPNAAPTPAQAQALGQGTNGPVTPNPNVPGSGLTGGMSQSTQQGTPTGGGSQSSGFGNPIGPNSIEGVLGNIMSYLQGIAGTIAVIFIIIGGVMYMISGGSKEMTERAKKTLICAIAGLAIVLAAPLFYQEIRAILSGGSPGSALQQILMNVLRLLLSIVGFLAIISMVVGAIWMFTAVGDEDRYELGKKMAGYSIFGLVIALSALIIANQVTNLLGG